MSNAGELRSAVDPHHSPRDASLPGLAEFDYHLLPGELARKASGELERRTFHFWQTFWSAELAHCDTSAPPFLAEDFYRQDFITVLTHVNAVVGLHAYSLCDTATAPLESLACLGKYFPRAAIDRLANLGAKRVMSMEYWSVAAEWRPLRTRISLGVILALLGLRLAKVCRVDAVITAVRADRGGANVAFDTGARSLHPVVSVYGVPTELVYWTSDSIRPSKHPRENDWAESLWTRRKDQTGRT